MNEDRYTDRIIVKVTLKAPPDENESSIQNDWAQELHDWVDDNDCEIQSIEWTRYRKRYSVNHKGYHEVFTDVIEQSTTARPAEYGQTKEEAT